MKKDSCPSVRGNGFMGIEKGQRIYQRGCDDARLYTNRLVKRDLNYLDKLHACFCM